MTRKYFGTDGIRGEANSFPMTADMALKVAMATTHVLKARRGGQHTDRVVIGKDTRLSCYMLEQALSSGFLAMGMEVVLTGPLPTPAIAFLTRSLRADVGVMISASHNPYKDNGIKLFGADGYKLSDDLEQKIEATLDGDLNKLLPGHDALGKASRLDDAAGRYIEFIKGSFPKGETLHGLRIVVDCANGAAYKVAPQVLWELEAEVIAIGNQPDGRNINEDCGATHTEALQKEVLRQNADIGIALDGDADRVIIVDEKGQPVDGDQLLGLLAVTWKTEKRLSRPGVVSTVMSNLGLEKFLTQQGLSLERAPVGDRYVVEKMREGGFNLGGEQSGHIVMADIGTTGDGLLAALQILSILRRSAKPASELCKMFAPYPQVLQNVRFEKGTPLEQDAVKTAIRKAEDSLCGDGRLLVRPSGTEPLIRVMAEGSDVRLVKTVVGDVCSAIEKAAKSA